MKKLIAVIVALLAMSLLFTGCGGEKKTESDKSETETSETVQSSQTSSANLKDLKQGDEVSVVGQVASSSLVNGDTLWVQVKQSDDSFVVYHCQLKSDYIGKAAELKLGSIAKIKGLFMSFSEFEQENTADLAQLYDCELTE